jgi:hypothetical protein
VDATLVLQPSSDVDDNELDELTAELRRRLLEDLDVSAVNRAVSASIPHNAKSADFAEVGALVLTLSPIALRSMFQLVQEWLKYRPVRNATVVIGNDSLEVTHLTDADQRRLIESFIERHAVDWVK